MEFVVSEPEQGSRVDQFLARKLVDRYSRSQIKKLIEAGQVRVEGGPVSAHYRVKSGEKVAVEGQEKKDDGTRAEAIPIDIVYEDTELLVVNKPAGMVVHPAHGNWAHTLVNALLYHVRDLSSGAGGPIRPGIVHRLDKDTSGLLVVAKNDQAHFFLARQFKDHRIDRTYEAIVRGVVQHDEGEIDEPVGRAFLNRKRVIIRPSGGKSALTYYRVKKRFAKATWLEIKPKTGRTHQIRVHLAHLGHPVLGDFLYGIKSLGIDRQALHASELGFTHPRTKEKLHFKTAIPDDMKNLIRSLEANVEDRK